MPLTFTLLMITSPVMICLITSDRLPGFNRVINKCMCKPLMWAALAVASLLPIGEMIDFCRWLTSGPYFDGSGVITRLPVESYWPHSVQVCLAVAATALFAGAVLQPAISEDIRRGRKRKAREKLKGKG